MNGQELLLKALKAESTDHVPVSPFLYYNSVYEMFDHNHRSPPFSTA
jgi:hypothetical protein